MSEVGKPLRRSKGYTLNMLRGRLGGRTIMNLDRQALIDYGRTRVREGAGPPSVGMEISYIKTILTHAAAVHGVAISKEEVDLARIALKRLGIVGRAKERNRRPTEDELIQILDYLDNWPRMIIPMGRIVRFAIATAMRRSEITNFTFKDVDARRRLVLLRNRKDPRKKDGNDQFVPLIDLSGYDAWQLIEEQRELVHPKGRVFPYNSPSVGTAFHRAVKDLGIEDLRFHDLRHEATSRLFEAGLTIERVALVTGHKDWKMLKRYTHLSPDMVFSAIANRHPQ